MSRRVVFLWLLSTVSLAGAMPVSSDIQNAMLPLTCAELLADTTPYTLFFEAIARSQVSHDRKFSKRLYRVLVLRDRLLEGGERGKDDNTVDTLIRKTLCFYREQKEPVKPIGFDDAAFLTFLKGALGDLETKVEQAVFNAEFEKQRRKEIERSVLRNQKRVDAVLREADLEADILYDKLAQKAKKKVVTQ